MKKFFIYSFAVAALMLTACNNDEQGMSNANPDVINLSASLAGPATRAVASGALQNTAFEAGASIHVDAFKMTSTTEYDATPYTSGNYTAAAADNSGHNALSGSLLYPAENVNIAIKAFYPNSISYSSTSFDVPADQTDEAEYRSADLMYSDVLVNKARRDAAGQGGNAVTHGLNFHHALSKIIVNVNPKSGDNVGVTQDDITANLTAVAIANTKPTATFTAGALNAITEDGAARDISILQATGNASSAGIIVPQTIANGTAFIKITYANVEYTYSLEAAKTFEGGKVYTFNLTLSAQGLSLSSTTIGNWTANDGGDSGTGDFTL